MQLLLDYLNARFLYVENNKALFQLLKIFCACKQPDDLDSCCYAELNLLRGDLEGIEDLLKNTDSVLAEALLGALYFIQDRNDASIERFQATLVRFRKETGKRNVSIGGYPEYLFYLALFRSQTKEHLDLLRKQLQSAIKHQTTGSVLPV